MSGVRSQKYLFLGQIGWASRWWVCYQRGLPRLLLLKTGLFLGLFPHYNSHCNTIIAGHALIHIV